MTELGIVTSIVATSDADAYLPPDIHMRIYPHDSNCCPIPFQRPDFHNSIKACQPDHMGIYRTSVTSCGLEVAGLSIWPSSAPCPLCPIFFPVKWNLEVKGVAKAGSSAPWSPSLEKKPRFFAAAGLSLLGSSFNPTSSKPSSCVGGSRSKLRSSCEERGKRDRRASSDWRPFADVEDSVTGDLAEISCETR